MSRLFASGGQSIGALASVLPMNIQDRFRIDWFDLLVGQGTLKSFLQIKKKVFSNTIVQKHQLFGAQLFMVQLSHPYMTTEKTVALTKQTFVSKVMSLLFNMLSRLVTAFLPRSMHFLVSWLQSPSAVILEPKKSLPLSPLFPHLLAMKSWDQMP